MPQIVEMYVAQGGTWVEMPGATVDSTLIEVGAGLDGGGDLKDGPVSIWVNTGAAIDTTDGVSVKVDNESLEILPYVAGDPTTDAVKVKLDPDGAITSGPSGLNIDTGAGLVKGTGGLAVNVDDDTLEVSTAPGQAGDDWVKVKDLGIANRHLNATVGGLTNVDISADGAAAGQGLVSDGTEFLAQDIAVIDMTTPPATGEVPVWDPALGNPPGTGAWVPTMLTVDTPLGSGLVGGGPLTPGVVLGVNTAEGIIQSPSGGIAVNVDDVTLEVADVGGAPGDFVKVKDLGISNRHLNATIGGLTNVDITADAPIADRVPLIWDSTAGEWVAGLTAAPLSTEIIIGNGIGSDTVPNGNGNLDMALGPVEIHADLGAGLTNDATDGSVTINLDNGNSGATTLPQALEITPFLAGDPDSDILQIKWLGVQNEHIGAQLGALVDVDISVSDAPVGGSVLYHDGTEWRQYDPVAASNPQLILGPIDEHIDVDTSTVPPVPGEGLIWVVDPLTYPLYPNGVWIPGAPVGQGITPLAPVAVATVAPVDLTTAAVDIDGFAISLGSRVLVKDQALAEENGIYDNGTPWTRSADADAEGDLIPGNSVLVSNGDVNGGISFLVAIEAADIPWTPGTDEDRWYASFSKLDIQAGDGLVLDGKILHAVAAPNEGLYVAADDIGIAVEGVKDKHIGAVLGAMVDVEMASASPGITNGIDGAALVWSAPLGQWQMGGNKAPVDTVIIPTSGLEITGNDDLAVGSVTIGIAPAGVQDIHMGAQLGSLTNVNDAATVAPLLNSGLIWSGAEWTASTLPVGTIGDLSIDDMTDVDTTSAPPAALQALVWDSAGNWVPGDVVSFGAAPPATPGIPVWSPPLGWTIMDPALQAGAGLLPNVAQPGQIDVATTPASGIAIAADAVTVDRLTTDTWYVSTTVDDSMAGGLTIDGASGLAVSTGGAFITSTQAAVDIGKATPNNISAAATTGRISLSSVEIQAFDGTSAAAFLAFSPEHVVTKAYLDTPATLLGSVDRHSDVDTTTAPPAADQALLWNGTNWTPGDVVALAAPPVTNTPGVPVWDGGAWVSVTPTVQAGAGLKVGAGTGIIDVGANADTSIIVNPDDIQVNRALLDTWYPAIPSPAPGTGLGNIIVWDGNDWVSVPAATVAGLGLIPSATLGGIDVKPGIGITLTDPLYPDSVSVDKTVLDTWYPALPPPTSTGGDTIVWDGAKWVAVPAATVAGAGLATNPAVLGEVNVGALAGSGILVNPNDIAIDRSVTDGWYPALPGAPSNPGDSIVWDGIQWVLVPAAQQAGAGLIPGSLTGSMDVVAADGSILVQADDIQVAPKGITAAKIADGAVGNLQSSVTLGGLNNVDITADTPAAPGHTIVWNGTEWVAQATAAPTPQPISWLTDADTTAATSVIGDVLTWDGANWVQGVRVDLTTAQSIAGIKTFTVSPAVPYPALSADAVPKSYVDGAISILSGQDKAVGVYDASTSVLTHVFLGAPAEFVLNANLPAAAVTNTGDYVLVSVDGTPTSFWSGAKAGDWIMSDGFVWTLIPLTNAYVTETDSPSVAGVISGTYATGFQIVDGMVGTADLATGSVDNSKLSATISGLTNVDVTADAAAAGQALVWDGTAGQWAPGDVVSFGTPPTGSTPGVPVWDPALGWITVGAATQAGAGLATSATVGEINVGAPADASILVAADSIAVNKNVLDGWYPALPAAPPAAPGGDTIVWNGTGWVTVPSATQAGAGLVPGAATGAIDVNPGTGISLTVVPDAVSIDRTVVDTWYPVVPPGTPVDGDSIIWNAGAVPPAWEYGQAGALIIDELGDVDTSTAIPAAADALVWNGTNWVPGARVDLTTAQTVAGVKTFQATPLVPNLISGTGTGQDAVDRAYVDAAVSLLSGQDQAVGTYNATTSLIIAVFLGAPAEFVAGTALPAAAVTNAGDYVLVSVDGDGATGSYPTARAGDWIMSDGVTWSHIPLTNAYVTETDTPSVAGVISGSYQAGFQIVDKAVTTADLADGAVTNLQLGATIGGLTNVNISADAPVAGASLIWDGVSTWVPGTTALDDQYVNIAGDTMTGALTINSGPLQDALTIPTGNFTISGGTISVQGPSGGIHCYKTNIDMGGPSTLPSNIQFQVDGGGARWRIERDITPESGGNVGSNFTINRYADTGGLLGPALAIDRASGSVTLSNALVLTDPVPTLPNHAASKQYVDQALTVPTAQPLDWHTDVDTTTVAPLDGEVLTYDLASTTWKPMPTAAAGIPVFANAAARDAEITAPTDGLYCRLIDTDMLQTHDGTGWRDLIAAQKLDGTVVPNVRYNKAGPADTLGASGPVVTPDLAASIQYVDDLVTVSDVPPVVGTIPKRDGQVWYVITTPPPPPPITPTAVATDAATNTVSWIEP